MVNIIDNTKIIKNNKYKDNLELIILILLLIKYPIYNINIFNYKMVCKWALYLRSKYESNYYLPLRQEVFYSLLEQ